MRHDSLTGERKALMTSTSTRNAAVLQAWHAFRRLEFCQFEGPRTVVFADNVLHGSRSTFVLENPQLAAHGISEECAAVG